MTTGSAGKYIRHIIAVLVGMLLSAVAAFVSARFGVQFADEQVRTLADGIANGLTPAVLLFGYAMTEKLLKRFPNLDPEGFTDRISIKQGAQSLEGDPNVPRAR